VVGSERRSIDLKGFGELAAILDEKQGQLAEFLGPGILAPLVALNL